MTEPTFKAAVRHNRARAGDPITVVLTVENPGPDVIFVPDPRRGGGSLVLRLKLPSGEERVITMGDPPYAHGVKPQHINLRTPPNEKQTIDFELGPIAPISAPGRYALILEYAWKPGAQWRSPEIGFTVQAR
jgi:hypothetical protein